MSQGHACLLCGVGAASVAFYAMNYRFTCTASVPFREKDLKPLVHVMINYLGRTKKLILIRYDH